MGVNENHKSQVIKDVVRTLVLLFMVLLWNLTPSSWPFSKAVALQAMNGKWFWYRGGMTVPGCPDWGVRWVVFETLGGFNASSENRDSRNR